MGWGDGNKGEKRGLWLCGFHLSWLWHSSVLVQATQKAARRQGPPFRRFTTPSGLPVLVGRNNRQNDELSIKVAREQDVWMHARHVPGAHVVLRWVLRRGVVAVRR